ncbi:MAG: hypothetical protein ACXW3L_00385, partial [Limisphaerales bacterium]
MSRNLRRHRRPGPSLPSLPRVKMFSSVAREYCACRTLTPPALPPTTITKPALYRICTANPQISVKPFPSFPDVTVFSGAAREFHALKMLTSVPLYRLVFRKSTFTKPALYRGFLHCTAKPYFFRKAR